MNTEEVFEKVKAIIVEQLGVTETSVEMEASFIDDLGADSLDIVELIMALEEEFDTAYYESFEHIPGTGDYGTYEDYAGNTVQINVKKNININNI